MLLSITSATLRKARTTASRRTLPGLLLALMALTAFGAPPALAVNQSVRVADNNYTLPGVAVTPGDTVTWTYPLGSGGDPHNVHFDDLPGFVFPATPRFSLWTETRAFNLPAGKYRYHCDEHGSFGGGGMSGVLHVNPTGTLPTGAPTASFTATPASVVVNQGIALSAAGSTDPSTDPGSTISRYEWDFDGDGTYESDRSGQSDNTTTYTTPGVKTIRLRVTDGDGLLSVTTRSVDVTSPPPPPPPPAVTPPPAPPAVMPPVAAPPPPAIGPPAPIVTPQIPRLGSRVSYSAKPRRTYTLLSALSVRGARAGSTVRLICSGKGCPFRTKTRKVIKNVSKLDLTSLVRNKRLRPGAKLEIRVTKPGTLGRVLRLTIRASRSPRSDKLCFAPGATKPTACSG